MTNFINHRTKYFNESFHMWPLQDPDWQGAMERYVLYGISPGGFLEAVLANNLYLAACRSHPSNAWTSIMQLIKWLANQAPTLCWGDPDVVRKWTKMEPEQRLAACRKARLIPTDEQITFDLLKKQLA